MDIKRIVRHLLVTDGQVGRSFGRSTLNKIEAAIKASEAEHVGEIRFVVEGGLDGAPLFKGQSARERAIELFSLLRVWDTQQNTGVLIYLLLADRAVEIVADKATGARFGGAEGTAGPMVRDACIRNGLMVRGIRDSIVMCPPLIITFEQIDEMIGIIRKSLDEAEPKLRAI